MPLSSFMALIKDLFSSSDVVEVEETAIQPIMIHSTPEDEVKSAALTDDLATAATYFERISDHKVQLQLLLELMKEEAVSESMISGLVPLCSNCDKIYMLMKRELAASGTDLLDLKANEQLIAKETYLQMHNASLFKKFPKSTLAKSALALLIAEMV